MDGAIFGAAVHLFGNGVRTAFAAVSWKMEMLL